MKASSCAGMLFAVHLVAAGATCLGVDPLETWVQRLVGSSFQDVTFGNNAFVAVGTSGGLYSSRNGADWVFRGVNSAYSFYGITYGGSQFLAVGTFALHLDPLTCMGVSTDGQSWQIGWDTWHPGEIFGSVAYGKDTAVAVNYYRNRLYYGTNFEDLAESEAAGPYWALVGTGSFYNVAFGGDRFAAVGGNGLIQTSSNGNDWLVADSGVTNNLLDVAYGNGTYVAVGREGKILRSSNGNTWIPCASPTTNGLSCIAFGAGVFLATGYPVSEVFSSTDGVIWQSHSANIPNPPPGLTRFFKSLSFGAGRFVGIIWDSAPYYLASTSIFQSGSVQVELSGGYRADLNGFAVTARGGLERAYTLQESTNLTNWTDLLVFTNSGPTNVFLDTSASNTPHRFFRTVLP